MNPPPVLIYTPLRSMGLSQQTDWCKKNFGPRWGILPADRDGQWAAFVEMEEQRVRWHFENEKMATVFLLRWS
jgi:hypothetical protein